MKTLKIVCLASVAAMVLALTGAQAAGPVSGTVLVQGTVTPTCSVNGIETFNGSWGGPIVLGELADGTTGLLKTGLGAAATQGNAVSVSVVCNSANPAVALSASALSDGVAVQSGYTSTVNYVAELDIQKSPAGTFTMTYNTNSGVQSPAAPGAVGAPLSTAANNVTVSVNTLSATGVLTAGSYTGQISITITPS